MSRHNVYDGIFDRKCYHPNKNEESAVKDFVMNTPSLECIAHPKPFLRKTGQMHNSDAIEKFPTFSEIYKGCLEERNENSHTKQRKYIVNSTPYIKQIKQQHCDSDSISERKLYQCLLNRATAITNGNNAKTNRITPLNDITITIDEEVSDSCSSTTLPQCILSPIVPFNESDRSVDKVNPNRKDNNNNNKHDDHDNNNNNCYLVSSNINIKSDCLQLFNDTPYLSDKWLIDLTTKSSDRLRQCELMNAKITFWEKQRILAEKRRVADLGQRLACLLHIPVITDPYLVPQPIPFELPYKKEKVPTPLPTLTQAQWANTESRLRSANPDHVLVENFRLSITQRELVTLLGTNWLSDMVINFYLQLLYHRSIQKQSVNKCTKLPKIAVMSTFFYAKLSSPVHVGGGYTGVRRWTRQLKLFEHDLILVPIHDRGMHWCLACVDFRQKTISYYDSMGSSNTKVLQHLKDYLRNESLDKLGTEMPDLEQWKLINTEDTVPQQFNGSDCGVFLCTFGEFLSRDAAFTFTQEDMPAVRRRMIYEIINLQLLTTNYTFVD